ncbi:MAG TPA: hypothetical protein VKG01_05215 [Thermoanaerobaculia bacterium]|nr:hypothetical protein [Thermoanaerobaculia bacterium]
MKRAPAVAAGAALAAYFVLLAAVNSYVAGGSDSSGYLNAARLFARGRVWKEIPIIRELPLPPSDSEVFLPLALRAGPAPGTMAPRYPPGLPLHMAALALVGGWGRAPFLAVPYLAIAALVLVFLLARNLGLSRTLAWVAVALLGASPIFFGMAIQPMSDVTATAWVAGCLFLGLRSDRSRISAIAAGAALGMAVLVRPTNILAAIPLAVTLWRGRRRILFAAAGGLPFAAGLVLYDHAAFGKAAETGYGAMLTWTMALAHAGPVFRHYAYWVPALMTPLLPLAWLLLPFDRRVSGRDRLLLFSWFAVFLGFYLFYEPFDDWWAVRFLLPGLPAVILAGLLAARDAGEALSRRFGTRIATAAGAAVLAAAIAVDVRHIVRFDLLRMWEGETVYREASLWTKSAVEPRSVILSMQMSGALEYYTGLPVARWDLLTAESFPRIRDAVRGRGFHWYALLRDFEQKELPARAPGDWTKIGSVRDVILWRLD